MKWSKNYKKMSRCAYFGTFLNPSNLVRIEIWLAQNSSFSIFISFSKDRNICAQKLQKIRQNSSSGVDILTIFKSPFFHKFMIFSLNNVSDTFHGVQKKLVLALNIFQKVSWKSRENSKNYPKLKWYHFLFPLTVPKSGQKAILILHFYSSGQIDHK